jgi:Lipocalin-like domain
MREDDAGGLVGCWELKTYTLWKGTQAEHPYGDKPQGMLFYDQAGRMSVQFMRLDRPEFASGDRWKGTAAELKAAFEGYFSYYGRYEVDPKGGVVIHHVEGSLLPNWTSVSQKRYFILAGKQLTLTTPTVVVGDSAIKTVLLWDKREQSRTGNS